MMSAMDEQRWQRLMAAWNLDSNLDTFRSLSAAYSESSRCYHTSEHIASCLTHLDRCAPNVQALPEVELALWFHDAVYQVRASDNERRSAEWARDFLLGHDVQSSRADTVYQLIMVTEHGAPTKTPDEAVLVDIDLSILGAESKVYDHFERSIRKEYRWVPFFLYRKKRAEILNGFLQRTEIYTSGCFDPEFERRAKENLSRAIAALR